MSGTVEPRIESKFQRSEGCWHWEAATNPGGYGMVRHRGGMKLAHRVLYELLIGPIPEGLHLHHECGARSCVNPWHLRLVTRSEHARMHPEGAAKWRAERRAKTECNNGHAFTQANTYWHPNGRRICRTCRRESSRLQQRIYRRRLKKERSSLAPSA